jgi:hypothetical protein
VSAGILVVSSCTATKLRTPDGPICAESLYAGQQHMRLMRGIGDYRNAGQPAGKLRFHILSAFYGLLPSSRRIASYDHSFSGLPTAAIRRQGHEKNVPEDVRKILRKPFDFGMLLLGDPYLRACELDADVELGGPLIVFCSPAVAKRMPRIAGLRTIILANAEARRFSCGLIALKGELGGRLLSRLAVEPDKLNSLAAPDVDVLRRLEETPRLCRARLIAA